MRKVQFPEIADWQCLGFFNFSDNSGRYIGEDGLDLGITASAWFKPSDGTGVVMLGNRLTQNKSWDVWNEIFYRLFEEAERL